MKTRGLFFASALGLSLGLAAVQSGCKSAEPKPSASVVRQRQDLQQGAGAAALQSDAGKETSLALARVPVSCPSTVKYRLAGFSMQCAECHSAHTRRSTEPPDNAAKQKTQDACSANLRYIGLAARTWAEKHDGVLPFSFTVMANELRSPLIIICPAQPNLHPMQPWEILPPRLTWLDASYEIVAPWKRHRDPGSVYVRCPIHQFGLRADGRVAPLGSTNTFPQQ